LASGSGPAYIGHLGQNLYPFQGTLDEVAVFASALSAERVRAHYQGGVTVRLNATANSGGTPRTTAAASASETDPDTTNNTLALTSTVTTPRADLALSGSVSPDPANVGDTLAYQLVLTNRGPARASGATLSVTLPAELGMGAASTTQGACSPSGQTLSCALGALDAGPNSPQVLSDRPSGYWRLGEASGASAAADSSGNGLTGAYDPGVGLGQPGAMSGDSASSYSGGAAVVLAPAAALDLSGAVSVEAWVRPSAASQNGGIFEKTINGSVNSQYMLFLEAGAVKFRVRTSGGVLTPVDGPVLPLQTWSHVVGTFDGGALRLYVNGALVATTAASQLASGSGPAYIGHLGQNLYPFQGSLDEVAVFASALSAERVRAHYQGGVTVRLNATANSGGTPRTTAAASASETDPDTTNNTLALTSTIR